MNADANAKQTLLFRLLIVAALVCLAVAYVSPIWWVSLKAPQYPEVAFPQGIRIHFHVDKVENGCQIIESAEKTQTERLNCKHEMDAINHYVGMYPIAAGGPVERAFSPFLFSLLGLMIVAFAIPKKGLQVGVVAAGSLGIAVWMTMAMFTKGGVLMLSPNYIGDFVGTMDLDLKDYADWSGFVVIDESYREALGRYFRDMQEIGHRSGIMNAAAKVTYWGILAALAVLSFGVWKWGFTRWVLVIVPALLPVFFVIEYSAWLWWFGHNLHEMAAFTIKPFMPTVFGQGKVAQFSTHSYPHYGFALFAAVGVSMALAGLLELKRTRMAGH
ncbi:MAG: hypothetical protein H7841_05320 [Magnetospirillum sp. WYHS-4]